MQDYLIVSAALYDEQNNLVNFGDYQEFGRIGLAANQTSDFDICIPPPNHGVARYDLLAWGH